MIADQDIALTGLQKQNADLAEVQHALSELAALCKTGSDTMRKCAAIEAHCGDLLNKVAGGLRKSSFPSDVVLSAETAAASFVEIEQMTRALADGLEKIVSAPLPLWMRQTSGTA